MNWFKYLSISIIGFSCLFVHPVFGQSLQVTTMSAGGSQNNPSVPGQIITVDGQLFRNEPTAIVPKRTDVYVLIQNQKVALRTRVQSLTRLYFVVPMGLGCGEHRILLETVDTNNNQIMANTPQIPFWIRCVSSGFSASPAKPSLIRVDPKSPLQGSTISITGRNFLFPSRTGDMTKVEMNGKIIASRWISPTLVEADIPSDMDCNRSIELKLHSIVRDYPSGPVSHGQRNQAIEVRIDGGSTQLKLTCTSSGSVSPLFQIINADFPSSVLKGSVVSGTFTISNTGDVGGDATIEIFVANQLISTLFASLGSDHQREIPFELTFHQAGDQRIDIRTEHDSVAIIVNVRESITPPELNGRKLEDFDTDRNCRISDQEFFVAIDAWVSRSITDEVFFSVIDAWIGRLFICETTTTRGMPQHRAELKVAFTRGYMHVRSLTGNPIAQIEIYNSAGKSVYRSSSLTNHAIWNLRDELGRRVANGVYFLKIDSSQELMKVSVIK